MFQWNHFKVSQKNRNYFDVILYFSCHLVTTSHEKTNTNNVFICLTVLRPAIRNYVVVFNKDYSKRRKNDLFEAIFSSALIFIWCSSEYFRQQQISPWR